MKKSLKSLLVGKNEGIHTIRYGIARGLAMQIDPNSKSQRILGLDEREIQGIFKKYAADSGCFFDIGASDGYYSLIFKKFNPTGKIYAFEVKEDLVKEMKENFERNRFPYADVTQIKKFVSDRDDANHVSVDSFGLSGQKLFFKIDVDGGEMDVLKGMERTIAGNSCRFIVETHTAQLEKDCIAFLKEKKYSVRIIRNAGWRVLLPEDRPIEHNRWFSAEKS